MSLAIVIPVTDRELPDFRAVFATLRANLRAADVRVSRIVVVLQSADGGEAPDFLREPEVEVIRTSRFSASHARNLGMEALDPEDCLYVSFLDCDSVPSTGLLRSVRDRLGESDRILLGAVRWCHDWPPGDFPAESAARTVPLRRVLFSTYLWATFLPAAVVLRSAVRFDESIGPGDDTVLKSGEDLLYLHRLAAAHDLRDAVLFADAWALHPSRPADYSKHLLYAEGQGALFTRLLRSRMRGDLKRGVLGAFVLFLGNAVVRVLTLRPSAVRILGRRLRGVVEGFRDKPF